MVKPNDALKFYNDSYKLCDFIYRNILKKKFAEFLSRYSIKEKLDLILLNEKRYSTKTNQIRIRDLNKVERTQGFSRYFDFHLETIINEPDDTKIGGGIYYLRVGLWLARDGERGRLNQVYGNLIEVSKKLAYTKEEFLKAKNQIIAEVNNIGV